MISAHKINTNNKYQITKIINFNAQMNKQNLFYAVFKIIFYAATNQD